MNLKQLYDTFCKIERMANAGQITIKEANALMVEAIEREAEPHGLQAHDLKLKAYHKAYTILARLTK